MSTGQTPADKGLAGQTKTSGGMGGFAKGLKVMEAFNSTGDSLTIAEVAQLTGLDRATARRCILTLIDSGYASATGRQFSLTPKILRLSQAYLHSPLPTLLQPYLESLAEQLQESCSSATLDGTDILYIARANRRRVMSIDLKAGTKLPAYCTSMGRVLLGALNENEAKDWLMQSERTALTQYTETDIDKLLSLLNAVRRDGYAINDQELELGLCSIAVPLYNTAGKTIASLNIGTQAGRTDKARLIEEFLPKMLEIQRNLQQILP